MDLSDFTKDKQNFDYISKDQQKVIVGKLHMLETLVDQLNCMRESYTRQLVVCGNSSEDDVFDNKKEQRDEQQEKNNCIETIIDSNLESIKVV